MRVSVCVRVWLFCFCMCMGIGNRTGVGRGWRGRGQGQWISPILASDRFLVLLLELPSGTGLYLPLPDR